jgi:iron(III) transport system substrate-binding protein
LLAAAKKEGKVALTTQTGVGYRRWIEVFEKSFPDIEVQQKQVNIFTFVPQVVGERKAGIYEHDIMITAGPVSFGQLVPEGVMAPVRPLIFRPDVIGDQYWRNGYEFGWLDNQKQLAYAFMERVLMPAINTDLVKPGEIKTVQDLLDPKWKGKILWEDVRQGSTFGMMNATRLRLGDETVKKLIVDQEPAFSRDKRQLVEAAVRGRYAVIGGVTKPELQAFLDQGLGKNVKFVDIPDLAYVTHADSLWYVNRAPHPSAAKLFANWVLTKEGQDAYSKGTEQNSRRTDVAVYDQEEVPKPSQHYVRIGPEDTVAEVTKTQKLLADLAGIKN